MFTNIKNFYPTPPYLITKMLSLVDWHRVSTILEPSAGKGNILDALRDTRRFNTYSISAIELNNELQATLRGKNYNVIDSDFMAYNGIEQFDLIIANPPFDCGDVHLLKMIDIMFSGQIVCLLNAETLKNPYSNTRNLLVKKLEALGAEIEYLQEAFIGAERTTSVEVALVYIKKYQEVEKDLFSDMREEVQQEQEHNSSPDEENEHYEVATNNTIQAIVIQHNRDRELVMAQLMDFYKNHKAIKKYLKILVVDEPVDKYSSSERDSLTVQMKMRINALSARIKMDYWKQTIKLDEVNKWLTSKKREAIMSELASFSSMEFTETNIRQLILNLIEKFPKMIDEAIEYLFDEFTKHAIYADKRGVSGWNDSDYINNIHYFSGWKTNNAYKVNKRVVMPFYRSSWEVSGGKISWEQEKFFDDIDMVMNYFSGKRHFVPTKAENEMGPQEYIPTKSLLNNALKQGENRKIDTEYFYVSIFKKGTVHFEFKDMDLLRRFNISACQGKNFLPHDYSSKAYKDMTAAEKDLVAQFDGGENGYKQTKNLKVVGGNTITDPRFLIAS